METETLETNARDVSIAGGSAVVGVSLATQCLELLGIKTTHLQCRINSIFTEIPKTSLEAECSKNRKTRL